ncbi:polysaccharide deacetylase family protein [Simiduia curdlanivorans]|uniref:Polysaccharide deacetylase family protein n=1 Tax=Simiduia curdlanivorans TaxID=1492769 RepID=A0ABV8V912_9GAMM|nr:polysaccharide deacetylase family protein [Simiduia curdlanivorans]MDN3639041.1 polysaccharide deacetylase family protein [Simiduia curdlanivorans]
MSKFQSILRMFRLMLLPLLCIASAQADWPADGRIAVSLAYDDALASQLDHALPDLNRHQLKASFYVVLSSPVLASRMSEWQALAEQGHELGNHTLFHPCRASLPNRDWVDPENNLDTLSVAHMSREVQTANTFLHALDGKTARTFTPPCFDKLASGENYLTAIRTQFTSIKGDDKRLEIGSTWYMPSDISGDALIAQLKENTQRGGFVSFTFHGVGGDHLAVSTAAHRQLVDYLAAHQDQYYVDSYINIVGKLDE